VEFGVWGSEFGVRGALRAVSDALIITADAELKSIPALCEYPRARRRARARKAIKPHLVLDGRMDCEKTGGPTKQVERRGRTKSGPIVPYAL
jgi:hypothetical protein